MRVPIKIGRPQILDILKMIERCYPCGSVGRLTPLLGIVRAEIMNGLPGNTAKDLADIIILYGAVDTKYLALNSPLIQIVQGGGQWFTIQIFFTATGHEQDRY